MKETAMSLVRSWVSLDEAESKYGVEKAVILEWVEEGIVRGETEGEQVVRVNVDDLELKLRENLSSEG